MNDNINKEELISIVIPIYRVEKYLQECVDSVLKQTYKNIEIILVDDGSPDKCGNMCDEYEKKDRRVKVIHKENGGLSDARNKGIEMATGKYVAFVDSDDYVSPKFIEILYNAIKEKKAQIAQVGIKIVNNEKKQTSNIGYEKSCCKTGKDIIKDMYNERWYNTVVWNKLYLLELFKEIKYPIAKIHEDEFTTYKILYNVNKVAIVAEYLYNYRKTNDSITGKKFNISRLDRIEALKERLEFFYKNDEKDLYNLTLQYFLLEIIDGYTNVGIYFPDKVNIQIELLKLYRMYYFKILKCTNIKNSKKIKLGLFYLLPEIYKKVKENRITN